MKRILIASVLVLWSVFSFSQGKEIQVRFIGNCGLYMSDGAQHFYIDFPYKSGAHHYMEYDLSELDSVKQNPIFVYTHKHSDHYSGKLVKRLSKSKNGRVYSPWNVDELKKLNTEIKDFHIEVFKTKHRFSINHCSYVITWHNKRIYISGDTENADTINGVKNIDWAFVPVWLVMDAIRKGYKLKDDIGMLAIYHIGPNDRIVNEGNDPNVLLLTKQGEIFHIPFE